MVIDCHMHVRGREDGSLDVEWCENTIEAGELLGIDVFYVSDLELTGDLGYESFHAANARVSEAVNRWPDWFRGWCFVNPSDPRALDEVAQRVRDEGFAGVKLYSQHWIDEPVQRPLIECCIEWGIPILMHAGRACDEESLQRPGRMSDASHFVTAAKRYPEAMLIEAHIGGGGDWEWALKCLPDAPSVYLDTAGSVIDEWMVDRCVEALGVNRLLFATDMTLEGGVGKVLDANLTEAERGRILGGNFEAILGRRRV